MNEFKDHVVQNPDKFIVTDNPDGTKTIKPFWVENPTDILQAGTPFNAAAFNVIPAEIAAIDQKVTTQLAETALQKNLKVTADSVTISNNNGYYPLWVNQNGVIYSSFNGLNLYKSNDNGQSYTFIHTFARKINTVREMDNGELLVGIDYALDSTPGEDFISSGNQKTFTKVITHSVNSRLYGAWNVNVHGSLVILGEYGNQGKAQKVWRSDDYGQTFELIFDLSEYAPVPTSAHLHGVLYDKYWDRIWLIYGDGVIDINDNQGGYYSDDHGQTWTKMYVGNQLLNMYAFEDSVLFFTDSAPNGVYRYQRVDKNTSPTLDLVYRTDTEDVSITHLCTSIFRANDREPLIMGFKPTQGYTLPPFILATYNGLDYFELWRDDTAQTSNTDINAVYLTSQNKVLAATTSDTRYATGSKLDIPISKRPNEVAVVEKKSVYPTFIDVRSLGLIGNGVDETRELLNAFRYVAGTKNTLYIPKGMTITVSNMVLTGLSDFNLNCLGKIKLINMGTGTNGKVLRLVNCNNVNIYELNAVGNSNTLGSLHDSLHLENCNNVYVRLLNAESVNANVLRIDGGTNITVDKIKARSTNTGMDVVLITAGENIKILEVDADGVGTVGNYGLKTINLSPASASSVIRNIRFGKVSVRSSGMGGLWIKNTVGATVEDIEFKELNLVKGASYSYTVRIEESYIINLVGVKKIRINGSVMEDKTTGIVGTALFMDNVEDFKINLDAKKVHVAYTIGETGIRKGILSGEANDIDFDVMRIAKADDTDFIIKFGEYAKATANRYAIITYGATKALTNVKVRNSFFTKPANSNNNIVLLGGTNTNVHFLDNDFTQWQAMSDGQKFTVDTAGILRSRNLGLNHAAAKPLSSYWNAGEIIYNTNPVAGGYLGWVCTVAGNPGTWKGFGLIEA